MSGADFIHPYIPNSVPEIKQEMLREVGAVNADELYRKMIPERLLLKTMMNLPEPILSEYELKKHIEDILSKNRTCSEYLNFKGAGCWQHYVPEICDLIVQRSEILTGYAGSYYADHGRYQILWEYQSLLGELVDMDLSCLPAYDWGSVAGNTVRMAQRITDRKEILIARSISPSRLSIIKNYCDAVTENKRIKIKYIDFTEKGVLDTEDLKEKISNDTAGLYFENPSYLGVIEDQCKQITSIVHDYGSEAIVGVDPSSLGVLAPPGEYDADICCGEAQPLGVHMQAGGGTSGFIACKDEEKYLYEHPGILTGISNTSVEGEYSFGSCFFNRTSHMQRENAKDWIGTCASLWGVASAVYMSLMGPEGMRDLGEAILQKSHYTAKRLGEIEGIEIPYKSFFKEFPVNFESSQKSVITINKMLLENKIFGGVDLSKSFPELGQSSLYCVTEIHTKQDIDLLTETIKEALR